MAAALPNFDPAPIAALCRRHHIRRLAIFGSALHHASPQFRPDSDIDILVEFAPGARIGFEFITIKDELEALFGRPVDLLTPNSIRPAYRHSILSTARDLYVAA